MGLAGGLATNGGIFPSVGELPASVVNVTSPATNQGVLWNGSAWVAAGTQSPLDSSVKPATTAYADAAVAVETSRSTAADALLIPLTQRAAANGVATLDSGTRMPSAQLPASAVTGSWPVVTGKAAPPISKLFVAGHSIAAATAGPIYGSHAAGITAKLAARLGATETNVAVNGTAMMADNTKAWGSLTGTGSWVTAAQNLGNTVIPNRSRGPYLSPLQAAVLMWGVNDIAQWNTAGANFLAAWTQVQLATICLCRSGALYPYNDASVSYPAGTWSNNVATTKNWGPGFKSTASNNATLTVTIPADFDGQAVNFFLLGTVGLTATFTATIGGVQAAQVTTGAGNAIFGANQPILPAVLRVPSSATNFAPSAVITVTVTAIAGGTGAFFNCWGIEASPAPVVVLADCLRPGASGYYANTYGGFPYTPTDADLNAVNSQNVTNAATFTDGRVVVDGADAVVNKGGNWVNSAGTSITASQTVHPAERNCSSVAIQQRLVILNALSGAVDDLSLLGAI